MVTTQPTTTRFQEIAQAIQLDYAAEIRQAAAITDPSAMVSAINAINTKVNTKTQERVDKEVADRKANVEKQKVASDGFQIQAADVLGKAWATLKSNAEALTSVPMFIFRVERGDDDKLGTPTMILGKTTKLPTAGGTRNFKVTVDGKEYGSVAQAWKALMLGPDGKTPLDAPSKSASGRPAYSLVECQPLMEKAGHQFS